MGGPPRGSCDSDEVISEPGHDTQRGAMDTTHAAARAARPLVWPHGDCTDRGDYIVPGGASGEGGGRSGDSGGEGEGEGEGEGGGGDRGQGG